MAEDAVCSGFFRAAEGSDLSCLDKFQDSGFLQSVFGNILEAIYNFFAALLNPGMWLDWSNGEALMRFIYYGASQELFYVILTIFLIVTGGFVIPSTHEPSHGAGQTRPVNSGKLFVLCSRSIASFQRLL